jgi:hypothetical protein
MDPEFVRAISAMPLCVISDATEPFSASADQCSLLPQ